jgi:hypothetical protein
MQKKGVISLSSLGAVLKESDDEAENLPVRECQINVPSHKVESCFQYHINTLMKRKVV